MRPSRGTPDGHANHVEARLRAIVESCRVPENEREAYVAYARALYRSLRHPLRFDYSRPAKCPKNSDGSLPPRHQDTKTGPDENAPRPLGDLGDLGGFSSGFATANCKLVTGHSRAARVVQQFFERGLKGKLLVAIGREIEVWLFGQGR